LETIGLAENLESINGTINSNDILLNALILSMIFDRWGQNTHRWG